MFSKKDIHAFSLLPILCGFLMGAISLYLIVSRLSDMDVIVWDGLLGNMLPMYLWIVTIFAAGNILHITYYSINKYDLAVNLLYNISGFILAFAAYVTWQLS